MATPNEQLLSMLDPQQARLLDQQLRDKRVAQRAQGGGMLSGVVQAYTGMGDLAQRALGAQAPGANEQAALKKQQMFEQQQAKTKNQQSQVASIMKGAQGTNRIEKLKDTANRLRATGTYENLMLAEQLDDKAFEMQNKIDKIAIDRGKVAASTEGGGSATDGHLMKDKDGNFYQTFNYKNKLGQPSVKYVPLGGSPEYNEETTLVPVSKSGETVGMTAEEIVRAEVEAKGEVKNKEEFFKWKQGVFEDHSSAVSQRDTLARMIELTKQLAASGDLQGGIPARVQELIYSMTGSRPKNLGELQMLFSMDTLSRLKPLFGGNISDGERQSLQETFPNIMTGGKVNLEKLSVLERLTETAYASSTKKLEMTFEEYMDTLSGGKPKETKTAPKQTLVWTPDGWVVQ